METVKTSKRTKTLPNEVSFKTFNAKIAKQFQRMCKTGMLFRVDVSGDKLRDLYINSFEKKEVFRDPNSSVNNCNCCKNFIRRYGNVVSINKDGEIESIFSNVKSVGEFTNPTKVLIDTITSSQITDVFFEIYDTLNRLLNYESCKKNQKTYRLGILANHKKYTKEEAEKFGVVNSNDIYTFNHFCVDLPKEYVDFSGKSIETIQSKYRDKYDVFKRAMKEIPLDTLNLVKDLINQNSLLDATAHLGVLEEIIKLKKQYLEIPTSKKDNWFWETTYNMSERLAKFKNTLIGVLCTELAEGLELNKACKNWNVRVDPVNYHKATAPITKKQIKEAEKFVVENGYVESFNRRLATLDDIKASEIQHMNVDTEDSDIKNSSISIFENVKPTSTRHKRAKYDNVEEVSIEKFMEDILPSATSVEVLLQNKMKNNLVTMTTTKNIDSKKIFKWDNNYSWTFNGNLAGKSQIKDAVEKAGGNITGVLNFRLGWNQSGSDNSDLDAWALEPNGIVIGYSKGYRKDSGNKRTACTGQLDVDNMNPKGKLAVENITWTKLNSMKDGIYKLWVNQYRASNSQGFKAEIEFEGKSYIYEYNKPVKGRIDVAQVTLKNGEMSIEHKLPVTTVENDELWELKVNDFHKVKLVCKSPNHWGENNVGNLYYFFMLDKCKTKESVRSFHNENLIPELLKHRKVMEVLGNTNMIEPTDKQLSGLGFNSTVKDELIVKVKGSFNRMLKIIF